MHKKGRHKHNNMRKSNNENVQTVPQCNNYRQTVWQSLRKIRRKKYKYNNERFNKITDKTMPSFSQESIWFCWMEFTLFLTFLLSGCLCLPLSVTFDPGMPLSISFFSFSLSLFLYFKSDCHVSALSLWSCFPVFFSIFFSIKAISIE